MRIIDHQNVIRSCLLWSLLSVAISHCQHERAAQEPNASRVRSKKTDGPRDMRAWLGLMLTKNEQGKVVIRRVLHQSPAQAAELRAGDIIVEIDGEEVQEPVQVTTHLQQLGVGQQATFSLLREGVLLKRTASISTRPDERELFQLQTKLRSLPPMPKAIHISGPKLPSLDRLRGRVLVVDLFATWCKPCLALGPIYQAFQSKYGSQGLSVVSISSEDPLLLRNWAEQNLVPYTILSDEDDTFAREFLSRSLPTTFLVDKKGKIRIAQLGFSQDHVVHIEEEIQRLLREAD